MVLKRRMNKWLLLLLVTGVSNSAFAGLLSSTSLGGSGGIRDIGITEALRFQIGHGQLICNILCVPDFNPNSTWLDIEVDTSDVGSTFSADLADFPLLFNGVNDNAVKFVALFGAIISSGPEASLIFGDSTEDTGIDLAGFAMTRVEFTLDELTFISPGADPNGDGIWTEYSYAYTLDFYGNFVPVPASLYLFVLGVACLVWSRRNA